MQYLLFLICEKGTQVLPTVDLKVYIFKSIFLFAAYFEEK